MVETGGADWIIERPIAHRGLHDMNRSVWENTATAFERATKGGFAIECDLQMSSDGVPIVFHDYVLKRLCSIEGELKNMPADELTCLPVGLSNDTIPTLAQILVQIGGGTGLILELKPQEAERSEAFARAVVELLADYDGPAALMSFDKDLVSSLSSLASGRPVGLTAHGKKADQIRDNEKMLDIPIDFVSFHVSDLPCPFVDRARERGIPVITWTVRDEEGLELTRQYADQMTFEGFDPNGLPL